MVLNTGRVVIINALSYKSLKVVATGSRKLSVLLKNAKGLLHAMVEESHDQYASYESLKAQGDTISGPFMYTRQAKEPFIAAFKKYRILPSNIRAAL